METLAYRLAEKDVHTWRNIRRGEELVFGVHINRQATRVKGPHS